MNTCAINDGESGQEGTYTRYAEVTVDSAGCASHLQGVALKDRVKGFELHFCELSQGAENHESRHINASEKPTITPILHSTRDSSPTSPCVPSPAHDGSHCSVCC